MTPRLKTSKKWTSFPQELSDQIISAFEENFKESLPQAEIMVEGRIYPQEIVFRLGVLEKGRLQQKNFEISSEYSPEKDNAGEKIFLSVDAAASLLMDYLEQETAEDVEETPELPYTWREMQFENNTLFFQFSTINTRLEAEADKLLGVSKTDLYVDEEDGVDFDENAEFDDVATEEEPEDDGDGTGTPPQIH